MTRTRAQAWLIRDAEVGGERADLRIRNGRIHSMGPHLPGEKDELEWHAEGGHLIPGLHDHHIHLFALGASLESVRCGPPNVFNAQQLEKALQQASIESGPGHWLRGIGYHESVAGDLDRQSLDRLGPSCPIRIQHRSGARWIFNSLALEELERKTPRNTPNPLEKNTRGEFTGRLNRADQWLRERLAPTAPPELARVNQLLTSLGVTGCCDATPDNDAQSVALFERAQERGEWNPRLRIMGRRELPISQSDQIERGAWKILLDENQLPERSELIQQIRSVHDAGRGVAIHCVTRAELVFAASAIEEAGSLPLDRIEHASVAPPDCIEWLTQLTLAVITQPNFVEERGDQYLEAVHKNDQPWLYRCQGFLKAGVPLAGGTDAPFGNPDPWRAMRAAIDRRTAAGSLLGQEEALSPEQALALFMSPLDSPGGAPRTIRPGQPADLCLLDRNWHAIRNRMDAADIAAIWIRGQRVDQSD